MPFDFEAALDSDWEIFDEVETVNVERDGASLVSGVSALVFEERIDSINGLTDGEVKLRNIYLRRSEMDGNDIAHDDVIIRFPSTANEERYTVRQATVTDLQPDYQCQCTREV